MKKVAFVALAILTLSLSSCGYTRLADLNMISNRNIDQSQTYVLLERDVEVKVKLKKKDPLELAIDEATSEHEGEFFMNAKIYIKNSRNKIKIVGDVWGLPKTK